VVLLLQSKVISSLYMQSFDNGISCPSEYCFGNRCSLNNVAFLGKSPGCNVPGTCTFRPFKYIITKMEKNKCLARAAHQALKAHRPSPSVSELTSLGSRPLPSRAFRVPWRRQTTALVSCTGLLA